MVDEIKLKSVQAGRSMGNKITRKTTGRNRLQCLYINARSIVNKHKELELYVREENIDIIGISET